MKRRAIFSALLLIGILPLQAEKVTFDTKYTVEFPEGWKKSKNPRKDALVYRETVASDASFAVAKLTLPKKAQADLKGTL